MKEKLMYRGASKIPNRKSFRGNIKWFTTNKDYADSFAKYNILYANGLDASMTYTVDIDTDNLKLYNCGVTDFPLYNIMRPMKPYQISTFMEEMVKGLRIDEDTLKTLVNKVIEEYKNKDSEEELTDREIFKFKLWNVVKTDTFASLVKSRGYDGVITNEFGNECYGIFDDKNIKILDEDMEQNKELNKELFDELDKYVYHITSDAYLKSIEKNGLRNFWFAVDQETAEYNMSNMIQVKQDKKNWDSEHLIILLIPKSSLDINNCHFEEDSGLLDGDEWSGECYYDGVVNDFEVHYLYESLKEAIIIRDKRKLFEEVDDPDDISTFEGGYVEEDDTFEDDDLIKNEEILSTLYKYTHIKNKDSEDASYCFLEEICNIYGLDEDEIKDIALSNGYKLMKVFPNENVDGGLLIADKNCSVQHIKTDYLKFYGVEAEVEEYKGE